MNLHQHGAAKRLTFSLLLATSLGGCAVYPPYPADYAYYPAAYSSYGYYPYGYYPYGYYPYGYGAPYYVGPSLAFGLSFSSHYGGYGHYGFHGNHGFHGGWGGSHH